MPHETPWELHIIYQEYFFAFCETRIQHPDEIPTPMMDTCILLLRQKTSVILTKDLSTSKTNQRRVH